MSNGKDKPSRRFYALDRNLFTIVIIFIILSNGKDKPPRGDLVLCY